MDDFRKFTAFLQKNSGVKAHTIPYLVKWVSGYLEGQNRSLEQEIFDEYLNKLGQQKWIENWQINQADKALSLYAEYKSIQNTSAPQSGLKTQHPTWEEIFGKICRTIRIHPTRWFQSLIGGLRGHKIGINKPII